MISLISAGEENVVIADNCFVVMQTSDLTKAASVGVFVSAERLSFYGALKETKLYICAEVIINSFLALVVSLQKSKIDYIVIAPETHLAVVVNHKFYLQILVLKQVLVDSVIEKRYALPRIHHHTHTKAFFRCCYCVEICATIHIRIQHDLDLFGIYLKAWSFARLYQLFKHYLL